MDAVSRALSQSANGTTDNPVRRNAGDGRKSVSDENWFPDMCQKLLSKPGLELHLLTGIDERSCHRYANGDVKPSGGLIRALVRSPRGEAFVAALMDGMDDDWFRRLRGEALAARTLVATMHSL